MEENNITMINSILDIKKEELLNLVNRRDDPNDETGKEIQNLILSIHKAQIDFNNNIVKNNSN